MYLYLVRIFLAIVGIGMATVAYSQVPYDVVLAGGRVIDPESNLDLTPAYVGINLLPDGSSVINAVASHPLPGRDVVDCTGLIITPGFIETHSHADIIPSMRAMAFDGVTTALELESGVLPINIAYSNASKEGRPLNFGYSSSWTMARMASMDGVVIDGSIATFAANFAGANWQKLATPEQSAQTLALVEQGLKEGAIGIGMNLGYAPESNPEEFAAIAQLAAKYQEPVFVHSRHAMYRAQNGGPTNMTALKEIIDLAEKYGTHMHHCHVGSTAGRAITDFVNTLDAAQARGVNVTWESYPWGAGSTVLGTPNTTSQALWGRGMTPQDVYWLTEKRYILDQTDLENARRADPGGVCILHFLNEDNPQDLALMDRTIVHPMSSIASDAMPLQIGPNFLMADKWPIDFTQAFTHPRSLATHVKILANYVRDRHLLSLMMAVRKMSLMPAQLLEQTVPGMLKKGRLQVGADADIIVFKQSALKPIANYVKSDLPTGMVHVLVNGRFLIREGAMQMNQMPGRPIRGSTK